MAAAATVSSSTSVARHGDGTGPSVNNISVSEYPDLQHLDCVNLPASTHNFSDPSPANLAPTASSVQKSLLSTGDTPLSHATRGNVAPRLVLAAHSSASRSSLTRRRWVVDSGASISVVSSIETLDRIDPTIPSVLITTADGTVVRSAAAGPCSVSVINPFTRKVSVIRLPCAYYVPGAAFNLFSVQGGQQLGFAIHFDAQVAGYAGTIRLGSQLDLIFCCIQLVGGALTLTCPGLSPPVDVSISSVTACAGVTPPPFSSDAVSSFLRARNDKGDTATTWTLAEAHSHLDHRNSADILQMVDRCLLPRV